MSCRTSNAYVLLRVRFRGLRCVHTHLRGEPLTQDDLTDLALLRLDLMAAIDVDAESGLPGLVRAAHLLPLHAGELDNATSARDSTDFSNLRWLRISISISFRSSIRSKKKWPGTVILRGGPKCATELSSLALRPDRSLMQKSQWQNLQSSPPRPVW